MKMRRADRQAELSALVRLYQRDIDRFDQAVADRLGINRTDLRCLDILTDEAGSGRRVTPKELAEKSGMSPSAITTVLDRLERAGYARRVRDDVNRRRVLVALTPRLAKLTEDIFAPVAAAGRAHVASYGDDEIELLLGFFARAHQLRTEQIQALQETPGTRPSRSPAGSRGDATAKPTDHSPSEQKENTR
jgi:DNA-binding MarR family transcriptional regulator